MPLASSTSSAARTSLIYITIGSLIVIWTGVWYFYLNNNPPYHPSLHYFLVGLGVTGLTLIVIGLAVGRIGSSAKQADLPHAVAPAVAPANPHTHAAQAGAPAVAPMPAAAPAAVPGAAVPMVPAAPMQAMAGQQQPVGTTMDRRV